MASGSTHILTILNPTKGVRDVCPRGTWTTIQPLSIVTTPHPLPPPSLSTAPDLRVRNFLRRASGMDPATEQSFKEQDDSATATAKGPHVLSKNILPHLLNLYASRAKAEDFEIYAPNATFEDPLMCAHGIKQIKSAFYSLPKAFGESRIVEYTIQENVTGPGRGEVLIDNKQHYKLFGRDIDLTTLIKLQIEDGKITRHEDWWDKKPLKNRETVSLPLLGRAVELTRRGSMFATHLFMGFGKDPST